MYIKYRVATKLSCVSTRKMIEMRRHILRYVTEHRKKSDEVIAQKSELVSTLKIE